MSRPAITIQPGVCRRCGCTEVNPCFCEDSCYWVDPSFTLCNLCAFIEELPGFNGSPLILRAGLEEIVELGLATYEET